MNSELLQHHRDGSRGGPAAPLSVRAAQSARSWRGIVPMRPLGLSRVLLAWLAPGVLAWGMAPAWAHGSQPASAQGSASAGTSPSAGPLALNQPAAAPVLPEAKELFRRGTDLPQVGDDARALNLYRTSRTRLSSVPNTLNAAICVDKLGRHDEARELHEELITRFGQDLDADTRQSVAAAMAALRRKVGAVDVEANVDDTLVVDSRMRGALPLMTPVRVLPGEHPVRIFKDGYESFEQPIDVRSGDTFVVRAGLRPLAFAGRLRGDDPSMQGADLYVDGAKVGTVAWEGTLSPGVRVVQAIAGEKGSGPVLARVRRGRVVPASVTLQPLAADLRISTEPGAAAIPIDDVPVGRGRWQGRLPVGRHTIREEEEGYRTKAVLATAGHGNEARLHLRLRVDPDHPRWGRTRGAFSLQALGGAGVGAGFGGDAEDTCDGGACSSDGLAYGPVAALRASYEFPFKGAVELAVGVLAFRTGVGRTRTNAFDTTLFSPGETAQHVPVTYSLRDELRLAGPFVAAGVSYRVGLGTSLHLTAGAELGMLFALSSDEVSGMATAGGVTCDMGADGSGKAVRSAVVLGWSELGLDYHLGSRAIGTGLGLGVFVADGPRGKLGDVLASNAGCEKDPTAPGYDPTTLACAPGSVVVTGESGYGRFLVWPPFASIRRDFR